MGDGGPAPTARNSAAGAVIDGRLHVVGGRRSAGGITNVPAHEVHDPVRDEWTTRAPMPQAQGGLAAAAFGGRLHAFGGEFFGAISGVFKESWCYDPKSDTWTRIADMPAPRHGLGAVALDGGIHVVGGATQPGGRGRSTRHSIFRPGTPTKEGE